MRSIGERIRVRREELGLSQEELGSRIGYKSRSSVNKIELDQRNLTQSKIKAIADALDTTPSYIMGWDEEKEEERPLSGTPNRDALLQLINGIDDVGTLLVVLDAVNRKLQEHK